jgi:protein O-GlcNAc transferase
MPSVAAPGRPVGTPWSSPSSLIEIVHAALADHAERPGDAQAWEALGSARKSAAAAIASLPRKQKTGREVTAALEMVQQFCRSGSADYPATADALARAREHARAGWPGLLASMVLVPAWQWPEAPRLDDVPAWLWPVYVPYLFHVPQGFTACGQAEPYAAHYLRRLGELCRLAESNRGSAAVRSALSLFEQHASCSPLYASSDSLRRHWELRGRILDLASGLGNQQEPVMLPRSGRRMRVGHVNRGFASPVDGVAALPFLECLDPERFEVILFTFEEYRTPTETRARNCAAEFRVLPPSLESKLSVVREAALDALVFGFDLNEDCGEATRLALHRIAPLQIAHHPCRATSGLPQIDLYLSGGLTESAEGAAQFCERLALLPGPAHAFHRDTDEPASKSDWTRAALGLPEDAVVFVTAASYLKITPEMQETWARLLAAVPGSRLLTHSFGSGDSSKYTIKRFCTGFDQALKDHGVEADRFLVSSNRLQTPADVRALLGVGDVYLDTHPWSGAGSLVDSLEAGIPAVVWEGGASRARAGGGLLRSLGLDELISRDAGSYHQLALRLATDRDARQLMRQRIQEKMAQTPLFLDPLAASDAFGALLERAFDELFERGREAFRRDRTPIAMEPVPDVPAVLQSAASMFANAWLPEAADEVRRVLSVCPAHPQARHLLAAALLRQGRGERALAYLLAAVQTAGASASLWHDLAVALHLNERIQESLQALRTCLQIDPSRVESWFMLREWAMEVGDAKTADDAIKSLQALAPSDARVCQLTLTTPPPAKTQPSKERGR